MAIKFGDFIKDAKAFEQREPVRVEPFHGCLKVWKADRYFGFIERDGGDDVFVHGSVFEAGGVEPVVGTRLAFETATDHAGRQRVTRLWAEPAPPEAA